MTVSDFEADVLFDLAVQTHHWKTLHDPQVSGLLDPNEMHDLCLKAGYTEEGAQKAGKLRAEQRLDKGMPMFQTSYVHQ
mgnify:CR=1 FL=1